MRDIHMQDFSAANPELVKSMKESLSAPRFEGYTRSCDGDEDRALRLYQWNTLISQSLYVYLQCWEICLRNRLNGFLCWRYNPNWPYDEQRAVRNLNSSDKRRLRQTIQRQEQGRNSSPVSTNIIVADLSAGFWVSLLSGHYKVPFAWRNNLTRVFPNDTALNQATAWEICNNTMTLRNRIAHHEPVHHLPLKARYRDLQRVVAAMCPGAHAFASENCSFHRIMARRP